MFHLTKKRAAVVAVVGSLAMAAGAYAYFTSTGGGTGSATVGTSSAMTIAATAPTTLFPTTSSPVTVTVTNPGSGAQKVGTVKLDSITSDKPGCDVSSNAAGAAFTMADVVINRTVAAGDFTAEPGTLMMNDTGANQDACQGAALTLHLSSAPAPA